LLFTFTQEYRSRSFNCCNPDCLHDVPAIVFVAELGRENALTRERTSEATSHLVFRTPKHKALGLMNHHFGKTLSIRGISQD